MEGIGQRSDKDATSVVEAPFIKVALLMNVDLEVSLGQPYRNTLSGDSEVGTHLVLPQSKKTVYETNFAIIYRGRRSDQHRNLERLSTWAGHGPMTLGKVDNIDRFVAFSGKSIARGITGDAVNAPTWW